MLTINARNLEAGFSLLELAIVLLISGLLLGGLIMPLSARLDQQKIDTTRAQLETVREALVGYALARDALPCPATPASSGTSAATATGCTRQHGFVPAVTLGIPGTRNRDQLLLDAWGSPIRYSVSNSDVNGNGNWDFVRPGEMRTVTIAALGPDLDICSTTTGSSATACANAASTVTNNAPAVLVSLGKDWAGFTSADQTENVGANVGGGPSGVNYPVANDQVFVMRTQAAATGSEFDDLVTWVSPNALYGAMVSAGRLP
jgi:type II secretory pathway pseudopilin PulG